MTGWRVERGVIPGYVTDNALRAINIHLYENGLSKEEARAWSETACWFPDLCDPLHPALEALLPRPFRVSWCDVWTQIILQFPHKQGAPLPVLDWHVDIPPADRPYKRIVGVPLTRSDTLYGGIAFRAEQPALDPGDVVVFDPDTEHLSTPNLSGAVRVAVYFRFLERAAA